MSLHAEQVQRQDNLTTTEHANKLIAQKPNITNPHTQTQSHCAHLNIPHVYTCMYTYI